MNLSLKKTPAFGAAILLALSSITAGAQVSGNAQTYSASHVSAEMTKGKLNPSESKPGDTVALRLKDDVKSNGEVVLKKGTTITGIVRNVKRSEAKGEGQSMMAIEWLAPAAQGNTGRDLSFTLQSIMQVNSLYQHEQNEAADDFGLAGNSATPGAIARPARPASGGGGGGLLSSVGGSVAGATAGVATIGSGAIGGVTGSVASTAGSVTSVSSTQAGSQSNAALLNMPSVVAVDHQTSAAIENQLGAASSNPLFKVGHGEMVSAGGSKQSVDIFSHLNNDTVITSPNKNFEITSGAQMQMLVGVRKN